MAKEYRYIVFFDESPDMLQTVVDKMLLSEYFCMTVPANPIVGVPENLEKLVLCEKIEPAVSLSPESILPVFAMLSVVKPEESGLLTKKHLQNAKFTEYLIDFFDNSRYVKPAIPLYIIEVEKICFSKETYVLNSFL
ncbi:hypothetical protein ATZ36_11840 [Candidatus Endomicrobiellum trichonymphae]|uniref:Uncharacterized protein n=1 Tax=Endomicrobium trichonymphae TaxID=1408204 RepID=A0A1E5IPC2_ENDTX|nr:hypothetical protein ATZ36_11840 [Candidatus Endomicrobium trichonymphae]